MTERRIAVIPARGNSKGIPGKNLHPVAGRPLLSWTVLPALESALFAQVVVSSESPEVLACAESLGATPLVRPASLSQDHVHSVHVVLHAIEALRLEPETMVTMLLPTSPLRTVEDIVGAVARFEEGDADAVVSVYRDPHHLLHFRQIGTDGMLRPLVEADPNVQRQDMEPLYAVNGSVYISSAGGLLNRRSFHLGRVAPWEMDRRRSVDIDHPADIADAELRLVS